MLAKHFKLNRNEINENITWGRKKKLNFPFHIMIIHEQTFYQHLNQTYTRYIRIIQLANSLTLTIYSLANSLITHNITTTHHHKNRSEVFRCYCSFYP